MIGPYGTPGFAVGSWVGSIDIGGQRILIERDALASQPLASVTRNVTGKVPTSVGIPERTPSGVNVIPAGSVPVTVQMTGSVPPDWVSVTGPYGSPG